MDFLSQNPFGIQRDLQRLLQRAPQSIKITGSDSGFLLASLLRTADGVHPEPSIVVVPSAKDARRLADTLSQTLPDLPNWVLPEFDVWPSSGLYPSPRITAARVGWCARVQHSERGLFIATARSIAQWTTPQSVLKKSLHHWKTGDELPANLHEFLDGLGYRPAPFVEDLGHYSLRGSILDLFCPYYQDPLRIELFGDSVESIRRFDPSTQRSIETLSSCWITPCQEIHWGSEHRMNAARQLKADLQERGLLEEPEAAGYLQDLAQGKVFPGLEYLTSLFYAEPETPADHLPGTVSLWVVNPLEVVQTWDQTLTQLRDEREKNPEAPLNIKTSHLVSSPNLADLPGAWHLYYSKVDVLNEGGEREVEEENHLRVSAASPVQAASSDLQAHLERVQEDLQAGYAVLIGAPSEVQGRRIAAAADTLDIETIHQLKEFPDQLSQEPSLFIVTQTLPESLRLPEDRMLFLRGQDLFPRKRRESATKTVSEGLQAISFQDLNVGDNVVHSLHGVGVFEGMKVMSLHGVEAEYLELRYKDKDRLYLPIYRLNQLHKYGSKTKILDKLGGTGWAKTKSRVKKRLREMADELLRLYTLRKSAERPPITTTNGEYLAFTDEFPFEETEDQISAIEDIQRDLAKPSPMDRLICGDVGFGKTEIAMRAAFLAAANGRQVAILAPTTVLTFQHFENFKSRFKNWPFKIGLLNRFVSTKDTRQTIHELAEGKIDIVIGTHKLLNASIQFHNLGLLVVDEEQKFGVAHKEKLRQLRTHVDTLSMSATPLPRTLNMSFIGMRDLSMINTAPLDRLPTRTFVTKFDPETVRRAILNEVERGGQVFYLHNRVQSIYSVADELRSLLPGVRLAVGHGQMDEKDLEKTMVSFFHREIDVLVCTTIIEAGMDVPNANTMFIDDAQRFGLSQLYQLRGRVGRSRKRAYCYLLIPAGRPLDKDAQERLRVIQENTALGSGLIIAQHDLELRGAGTLLGEEQSGHIDSVGYEMFLELMEEAMQEAKGEEPEEKINPEINLKIPALIPRDYIPDLRVRLSLYRRLATIESAEDVDQIEDDLRDQFGQIPQEVLNLMGIMLICAVCRELGIKDVSAGQKSISLSFSENTRLNPADVVTLALREKTKFRLTPDNRLNIRTDPKDWPTVLDELYDLKKMLLPEKTAADTFVQP